VGRDEIGRARLVMQASGYIAFPMTQTHPYHPPVKRSIAIAGHKTSISLEPMFWDMLKSAADDEEQAVNALVARIDSERIAAPTPPGLASAIRVWLVSRAVASGDERGAAQTADGAGSDIKPAPAT
jgi:predicted DNA-binding ribbon-helix-helix protein